METESKVFEPTLIIHNFLNILSGVFHQKQGDDGNLPAPKQYIQEILSKDGVNMVITMLPGLASRVHDADATLHDNTYKRVFGEWKEWEVVMWDKRLNQSMCPNLIVQ